MPLNVRIRGADVPVPALIGAPLTFAIWIASLVTHDATRIAGPLWLLLGAVVFIATGYARAGAVLGRVVSRRSRISSPTSRAVWSGSSCR